MNIGNSIYRLSIDLVDAEDPQLQSEGITGFFYYRTENGGLEKQYYHSHHRRLLRSLTEEEMQFVKHALQREGYDVESFTVNHSPTNSFTYRRAFEKNAVTH